MSFPSESAPAQPREDWRSRIIHLPGSDEGGLTFEEKQQVLNLLEEERRKGGHPDSWVERLVPVKEPWIAISSLKATFLGYSREDAGGRDAAAKDEQYSQAKLLQGSGVVSGDSSGRLMSSSGSRLTQGATSTQAQELRHRKRSTAT